MSVTRAPRGAGSQPNGDAAGSQQLDLISLLCGPAPLADRFRDFNEANPVVYVTLVRLAREWIRRTGRRRLGIAVLWERMRWELSIRTTETPKLNNDYRAFYARLIMRQEPDLADIFETRRSSADEWSETAA